MRLVLRTLGFIVVGLAIVAIGGLAGDTSYFLALLKSYNSSCSSKDVVDLTKKIYREKLPNDKFYTLELSNVSTEGSLDNGGKKCEGDLAVARQDEPTYYLHLHYSYAYENGQLKVLSRASL